MGQTLSIWQERALVCALLQEIFEQMNITSETYNGFENFKIHSSFSTSKSTTDFILTDIQMPITDGFSVLKSLKNGEVDSYKNQAVIAMTGSREYNRDFYLEKGFSEMLPKPFSKQQLISVLERIFPERTNFPNEVKLENKTETTFRKTEKFDLSLLKSFLNTPQALEEVLTIFNTQTETDLQLIKTAIENNNIEKIKEIVHRMLTMFRQLKANDVIPILEKMEHYSEGSKVGEDYEDLVYNIQELQKALENRTS